MSCDRCGFDYKSINKNVGCIHEVGYFKDGVFYEPVKVGDPGDFCEGEDKNARCHDCGASMGTYHHANCDAERCPVCGGQLLICDCFERENEELVFAVIDEIVKFSKRHDVSYKEIKEIMKRFMIEE